MRDGGRRKRVRRHKDRTFPLSMIPSIAVPVGEMVFGDPPHLMGIGQAMKNFEANGDFGAFTKEAVNSLSYETIGYTPYQGTWNYGIWARNLGLIFGGLITHKLATKAGINKYMKNIPYIGKYVSL